MERVVMKLEVLRGETLGELNKLFREKVQLTERLEEAEGQIQYKRGYMDAFEKFQKVIAQVVEAEQIEEMKRKRQPQPIPQTEAIVKSVEQTTVPVVSGDGSK